MEDRGVRGAIIGAIQVTTERAEHLKPKSDSQTKEDWMKSIYISVGLDYVHRCNSVWCFFLTNKYNK